jgi:hypothetical protein
LVAFKPQYQSSDIFFDTWRSPASSSFGWRFLDLHIDSSIIALDAKATDTTATDPKGEGEKNADWARRMELYLGMHTDS